MDRPEGAKEPSMRTLRVRDVMKARVLAVTPSTPFRDVAELMLRHGIGAVPVVDDAGGLVGLISEVDLLSKEAYGGRRRRFLGALPGIGRQEAYGMVRSRGRLAREVMSAPVETAMADDPLRVVARRMVEQRLRHLVVVDDSRRMVGIVSRRDLLRIFSRTDEEIASDVAIELRRSAQVQEVDVSASVDDAVVTLTGHVADAGDVPGICRVAWLVPGVVDVVDRLKVRAAPGRPRT
jgi:CBS-domain-containing membrane protein